MVILGVLRVLMVDLHIGVRINGSVVDLGEANGPWPLPGADQ